jgi:hypothetical protein
MGVLNLLLCDQRKLYQARMADVYYFREIEPLITFEDTPDYINQEVTYIRNVSGSEDQNSYTGMIQVDDPIFCSDYSDQLWGVLNLNIDELIEFILEDKIVTKKMDKNPLVIINRLDEIFKLKPVLNGGRIGESALFLKDKFEKFNGLNRNEDILLISLYCSSLYLQLDRLCGNPNKFNVSSAKTKAGGLSGISNNGFTKKDFMARYTSGDKKKIWGNPYIRKEKIKGIGEVVSGMEKAGGTLNIDLAIDRVAASDFMDKIENAGVSSFYLGKKGLAYVADIRI